MREKTIGILGGMGPEATAELFYRIIKLTPAMRDQDHLKIIIYNNPKIPDRSEAIIKGTKSPLNELVQAARSLEKMGVDFIIIPCNTVHYYYDELTKKVGVPIINMIELTAKKISELYPHIRTVGIIATTGTVKARIYDCAMHKRNIQVIYPSFEMQAAVMRTIYKIKAGRTRGKEVLISTIKHLIQKGSQAIISGCTEVSLALKNVAETIPIIDPLQILAEEAVKTALTEF